MWRGLAARRGWAVAPDGKQFPARERLGAERLLLLTDVPFVARHWGLASESPIEVAAAAELRQLSFAAGSMGPKVEAACRFVERTGNEAAIGALADLDAVAHGLAGTRVVPARVLAAR